MKRHASVNSRQIDALGNIYDIMRDYHNHNTMREHPIIETCQTGFYDYFVEDPNGDPKDRADLWAGIIGP